MAKIYLINVGANSAHAAKARSPVFVDSGNIFEFVAFPDKGCVQRYPKHLWHLVRPAWRSNCHLDPDWADVTYGDNCFNRRARALLSVRRDDILLFWALLWKVRDRQDVWSSSERGWYMIGAIRVGKVLSSGEPIGNLPASVGRRVRHNAHVVRSRVESRPLVRVFIGQTGYSRLFKRAVDLGVYQPDSLLRAAIRCADGRTVQWQRSTRWNSALRGCRAVLDLGAPEERRRAKLLRSAIMRANPEFDLLADV
jgi:hypothetical protein